MDMNKVYSAHQIALIRASASGDRNERKHLREVADQIAGHIAWYKDRNGAPRAQILPAADLAARN